MYFKARSPLPSSAPTWASSRLPAPSQERDIEFAPALVPRNEEQWVGEGDGEDKDSGEKDIV